MFLVTFLGLECCWMDLLFVVVTVIGHLLHIVPPLIYGHSVAVFCEILVLLCSSMGSAGL